MPVRLALAGLGPGRRSGCLDAWISGGSQQQCRLAPTSAPRICQIQDGAWTVLVEGPLSSIVAERDGVCR